MSENCVQNGSKNETKNSNNIVSSATECSLSESECSPPASPCESFSSPKKSMNSPEQNYHNNNNFNLSDYGHHNVDRINCALRNEMNLTCKNNLLNSATLYPALHTSCPPLFMAPNLFKPTLSNTLNPGCPLNLSLNNISNSVALRQLVDASMPRSESATDSCPTTRSTCETPSPKDVPNNNNLKHELPADNGPDYNNSAKRPSPGLLCVVCGDTSSGKHYGILACNGCSGFFKRSVRRKLIYRCQAGTGSCMIDKQHRNQCQACRLKKCIQMGMNKDAVQNERQPRNTATIRPETLLNDRESERLLREGVAATVNALFTVNSGIHGLNSNQFANQLPIRNDSRESLTSNNVERTAEEIKSENGKETENSNNNNNRSRPINHFDYTNSLVYQATTNNSLITPFVYPNEQGFSAMISCHPDSLYETSARLLYMAVKWAKNLPSFASLTFRDQVILLEESWSELFLLCAIQWCLPLENCQIFSSSIINDANSVLNGDRLSDLNVLNDTLNRFKSIAVDPGEFACLKAISLFKPEARGLKDVPRIEGMQDQAQIMLLQHEKTRNPTSPTRFGRLLLLLLSLRFVPGHKIASIYFHRSIGTPPMEKLLCDMFKS